MIGVDTNVLAHAALQDEPEASREAEHLLQKASREQGIFISVFACVELAWVLRARKRSRLQIAQALQYLLDAPGVVVAQRELVAGALRLYRTGKADFADYMILLEGRQYGVEKLASFDQLLCKDQPGCVAPSRATEWS